MRRGQDQHDPAHSRVRSPGLLVLDDDTLFRTVVSDHLEARGYRCFRAATIADAESMIAVERVDLAIIDCRLPDGRGEAFSCRLRGQQPDAMQVLVTADSTVQPERLSDGGWAMDDFFVKSNEVSELLWRVEMHLAAAGRIRRLRLRERWLQQIATLPSAFVALEAPLIARKV